MKAVEDSGCLWITGIPTRPQSIHRSILMWAISRGSAGVSVDNFGVRRFLAGDNVVDNVENSARGRPPPGAGAGHALKKPTWRRLGG